MAEKPLELGAPEETAAARRGAGPSEELSSDVSSLQDYVERMRSRGYSDSDIKQAMKQSGWPDEAIRKVLR
jgi:hypothetical protein